MERICNNKINNKCQRKHVMNDALLEDTFPCCYLSIGNHLIDMIAEERSIIIIQK